MNTAIHRTVETLLFDYACGLHSSRYVRKVLLGLGYQANLRTRSHQIDVCRLADGQCFVVAI